MSNDEQTVIDIVKPRYRYLDIVRGICMISIVLGHLGNGNINRVVFTYHLPVFFLISGYFTHKEKICEYIKKRIRTLIIPYYFSCILIMLSYLIISLLRGIDKAEIIERLILWVKAALYGAGDNWSEPINIPGIGAIWFLWAMFFGGLIFQLLLRTNPWIRLFVIVLILYLANYTVTHLFFFPLSIQPACTAVFYIFIGYLWRDNQDYIYGVAREVKAVLLSLFALLWMNFIAQFNGFWLVHSHYGRGIVDILGSLGASLIVILLSKYVLDKKGKIFDLLTYLGRYSIIFLTVHIVELNTFPWHDLISKILKDRETPISYLFMIIVLKLVFDILVTLGVSKIPFVKVIFGMKKKTEQSLQKS